MTEGKEGVIINLAHTDRVMIEAWFPNVGPGELFRYWTEPDLLSRWWPPQAEIDPQLGGAYRFCWPKMDWTLRGRYSLFEPGHRLGFTWQWDHEPGTPPREVLIDFCALTSKGTKLALTHAYYSHSEMDQQERQGHIEGWTHFLSRLTELLQHKGCC